MKKILSLSILLLFGCTKNNSPQQSVQTSLTGTSQSQIFIDLAKYQTTDSSNTYFVATVPGTNSPLDLSDNTINQITFTNSSSSTISMLNIGFDTTVQNNGFLIVANRCPVDLNANSSCDVLVQFLNRNSYNNTFNNSLIVSFGSGGSAQLSIQLQATIKNNPDPTLATAMDSSGNLLKPNILVTFGTDFSTYTTGSDPIRTINVQNTGTGTASNFSINLSSDYSIWINHCPSTLPPAYSCSIQIILNNFRSGNLSSAPSDNLSFTAKTPQDVASSNPTGTINVLLNTTGLNLSVVGSWAVSLTPGATFTSTDLAGNSFLADDNYQYVAKCQDSSGNNIAISNCKSPMPELSGKWVCYLDPITKINSNCLSKVNDPSTNTPALAIMTESDLRTLSSVSSAKPYLLMNNISMSSIPFIPIGTFLGSFNGNNYTISGLTIDQTIVPTTCSIYNTSILSGISDIYAQDLSLFPQITTSNISGTSNSADCIGLFTDIYGGTVHDLIISHANYNVKDTNIKSLGFSHSGTGYIANQTLGLYAGIIAGVVSNANIYNISLDHVMLTQSQSSTYANEIGGITAFAQNSTIRGIRSDTVSIIDSVSPYIGGIVTDFRTGRLEDVIVMNATIHGLAINAEQKSEVGGIVRSIGDISSGTALSIVYRDLHLVSGELTGTSIGGIGVYVNPATIEYLATPGAKTNYNYSYLSVGYYLASDILNNKTNTNSLITFNVLPNSSSTQSSVGGLFAYSGITLRDVLHNNTGQIKLSGSTYIGATLDFPNYVTNLKIVYPISVGGVPPTYIGGIVGAMNGSISYVSAINIDLGGGIEYGNYSIFSPLSFSNKGSWITPNTGFFAGMINGEAGVTSNSNTIYQFIRPWSSDQIYIYPGPTVNITAENYNLMAYSQMCLIGTLASFDPALLPSASSFAPNKPYNTYYIGNQLNLN